MFISTKRNYKVLIRAFPDSGGQCLVDHGSESQPPPSLANWFPENHLIRMNAHAKPNCIFIHWTINDQFESDLDTLSYEVKRPAEINAVFMPTSTVRVATWPDTTLEISIIDSTSPAPWFRTFLFKDSLQIQTPNIQERNRFTFISGAETQYIFMNWKGRDPGPSMVETTIDTPVTVTAEIRTQYCVIWKSNGI